jgi:hypothetical protein
VLKNKSLGNQASYGLEADNIAVLSSSQLFFFPIIVLSGSQLNAKFLDFLERYLTDTDLFTLF